MVSCPVNVDSALAWKTGSRRSGSKAPSRGRAPAARDRGGIFNENGNEVAQLTLVGSATGTRSDHLDRRCRSVDPDSRGAGVRAGAVVRTRSRERRRR